MTNSPNDGVSKRKPKPKRTIYIEDLRQSAETIEAIRNKKARGTPQ